MADIIGHDFKDAHFKMLRNGWHVANTEKNSSVIFNVYVKENSEVTLMIDRNTFYVVEVC